MSTAPQILIRALDANGDVLWGQGRSNFLVDIDAVGQLLATRLRMFQGEWWADQNDGLPLWQSILGVPGAINVSAISLLIQQRILATPFVIGMSQLQAAFNSSTRIFTFSANVQTQFGTLTVTNQPTVPSRALP